MRNQFEMTDADMAEAAAEREQRCRAMLAEADFDAYIEALAEEGDDDGPDDDPAPVLSLVRCRDCNDTGTVRHSTGFGVADWVEVACLCRMRKVA